MKRLIALLMTAVILVGLCACGNAPAEETTEPKADYTAAEADVAKLDSLYAGLEACHGELHDHADTGGYSDGKNTLPEWKEMMANEKDMDFAAIVDHKQTLHMYLDDWDDTIFIGGTEAGTQVGTLDIPQVQVHYAMLFADVESFEKTLMAFPGKYAFYPNEDHTSRYYYGNFSYEQMGELARTVLDNGGFFTHVHPRGDTYMLSDNPEHYLFAEYTGLEVLCSYYGNMSALNNQEAYKVWTDLLALGHRVYATAGSDSHRQSNLISLTTLYTSQKNARNYLDQVRAGDFTAGPVGIRMAVGDTRMGGECSFEGQRLVISVGDFHSKASNAANTYRVDLYDDKGLVFSQELTGMDTQYFAIDADPAAKFYRAEVVDVTENYQFAIGNPIWNAN